MQANPRSNAIAAVRSASSLQQARDAAPGDPSCGRAAIHLNSGLRIASRQWALLRLPTAVCAVAAVGRNIACGEPATVDHDQGTGTDAPTFADPTHAYLLATETASRAGVNTMRSATLVALRVLLATSSQSACWTVGVAPRDRVARVVVACSRGILDQEWDRRNETMAPGVDAQAVANESVSVCASASAGVSAIVRLRLD